MLLLQQIGLTDSDVMPFLQSGQIEKLIVDRTNRVWHFHFSFDRIPPCSVYSRLSANLERSFKHIAPVRFTVHVDNPAVDEGLILDYCSIFYF